MNKDNCQNENELLRLAEEQMITEEMEERAEFERISMTNPYCF